jgi:UDP-glucose:glycoprotein glucosyltransferase
LRGNRFGAPIYNVFIGEREPADEIPWLKEELPQQRAPAIGPDFAVHFMSFLDRYRNVSLPLLLRDITNNWPFFLPLIEATPPMSRDYKAMLNELSHREERLVLNGRTLSVKGMDVYTLLEMILEEEGLRGMFQQWLGVKSDIIFRTGMEFTGRYLLDFRTDAVRWWNDLEKDAIYENWTTDFMDFVQDSRQVRRNLVHMVCYFNLANARQLQIFAKLTEFVKRVPLRLGLVPHWNLGTPLSRKIAFAFEHLAIISDRLALDWLMAVQSDPCGTVAATQAAFASAFDKIPNKTVKWSDIHKLFAPSSTEFKRVMHAHEYFGFCAVSEGTMMLDGKIHFSPETDRRQV